ncbi:MAG: hypothetical protein LBT30_01520 [Clostridiales bacterium]|jgi:hypothetical protein|nr:hypothetical protein [Clostridiales bacterium]
MQVFFYKLLMDVLLWILRLLDGIFSLFKFLSGIETVNLKDGSAATLVDYFLGADAVTKVFWSIFLISIIVIAFSVIAAVVKSVVNMHGGERKPHGRTVGQGVGAIFVTIAMAAVMLFGISASNQILVYVHKSFTKGQEISIAKDIFDMSVEPFYEIDEKATRELEDNIDADGNYKQIIFKETQKDSGYINDNNIDTVDIFKDTGNSIFGSFVKSWGFEQIGKPPNGGKVDINSFNFLIAYFSSVALLVVLCMTMLGLVKRIYDLLLLFLSLPLIAGTVPLNDGAYFKLWRETVISKVILVYGAVISVNVFLLLMPLINGINFNMTTSAFMNNILKLFLIVGGGLSINGGQLLFARLFGTSAEESREMTQAARSAIAMGAAGIGTGKAIKTMALGGRDKAGNKTAGILGKAKGAAGGAVNFAGNTLGGNAYRSMVGGAHDAKSGLMNALKGSASSTKSAKSNAFMQRGGIIGSAAHGIKAHRAAVKTEKNKEFGRFALEQLEKKVIVLPGSKNKGGKK